MRNSMGPVLSLWGLLQAVLVAAFGVSEAAKPETAWTEGQNAT